MNEFIEAVGQGGQLTVEVRIGGVVLATVVYGRAYTEANLVAMVSDGMSGEELVTLALINAALMSAGLSSEEYGEGICAYIDEARLHAAEDAQNGADAPF